MFWGSPPPKISRIPTQNLNWCIHIMEERAFFVAISRVFPAGLSSSFLMDAQDRAHLYARSQTRRTHWRNQPCGHVDTTLILRPVCAFLLENLVGHPETIPLLFTMMCIVYTHYIQPRVAKFSKTILVGLDLTFRLLLRKSQWYGTPCQTKQAL